MVNIDFKEIAEQKIPKSQVVGPLIAVAVFMVLIGSLSYAYFSFSSMSANNTTYLNAAFPTKTNKTVTVTKNDCSITVALANMVSGQANNTTPKWTGTCNVTVTINGSKDDQCNYNVTLVNGTTTYTPCVTLASGTFEYSGTLSGAATKAETQMNTLAGTKIAASQNIKVATANTAVTKVYTLTTKWYNLNADQSCLLSATAATTFRHQLKVIDLSCDMNH